MSNFTTDEETDQIAAEHQARQDAEQAAFEKGQK